MKIFAIEMTNITKTFGNLVANNDISIRIPKNSIYGIIGENGAGKSTLMSILFGLYKPDTGVIKINSEEVKINSPHDASKHRIGMVHQHFKLVGVYNAVDNIILGNEIHKFGFLNRRAAREKIKMLAEQYDFQIDLNAPVSKMSVGQQQKVEILKTLFLDSDILIFDEPTAVLTPQEIVGFLRLLEKFCEQGKTIILITHKLDEIKKVCTLATVIRHGRVVSEIDVENTSTAEMAKLMVGSEVHVAKNNISTPHGEKVLALEGISFQKLSDVSFDVHAGEIVAIAGVEGNGQSEIIKVITGLSKPQKGKVLYAASPARYARKKRLFSAKDSTKNADAPITEPRKLVDMSRYNIKKRIKLGVAHIPEDRHGYGLILGMKIKYNIAFKSLKAFSFLNLLNEQKITAYAKDIIKKYDVRGAHSGDALAKQLSGGNQQKAIIGREIESDHDLIVVAQPTRGLDVGAILNVHNRIIEEKSQGKAVLLISYELSEVMSLADRIIVVNKGSIVGEADAKAIKREEIGLLMAGIPNKNHTQEERKPEPEALPKKTTKKTTVKRVAVTKKPVKKKRAARKGANYD